MELLVAALALLAFTSCAVVGLTLRLTRSVRRRALGVRQRVGLLTRSQGHGPAGEVARLRRDLDRSLAGARQALEVSRGLGAPVGDVPSLLPRLEAAARAVDGELRLLETQPDPHRVAVALPGPRRRAHDLAAAAADVVDGLVEAAAHGEPEVRRLRDDCSVESRALREVRRPTLGT
jgi:hypothetical protein